MVYSYIRELTSFLSRQKLRVIMIWGVDKILEFLYNTDSNDDELFV